LFERRDGLPRNQHRDEQQDTGCHRAWGGLTSYDTEFLAECANSNLPPSLITPAGYLTPACPAVSAACDKSTVDFAKMATKFVRIDDAPMQGRTARGRKILDLKAGDRVTGIILPREFPRPVSKSAPPKSKRKSTRKTSASTRTKKKK